MRSYLATVSDFLAHLNQDGFGLVPQPLSRPSDAEHVVSFVPGEVHNDDWPEQCRSDVALGKIARMVRRFHESSARYRSSASLDWISGRQPLRDGEVVLHGDFSMANLVWDGAEPVGIIDWEFAEPGPAYHDVLHAMLNLVPLFSDTISRNMGFETSPNRIARMELFLAEYGTPTTFRYPEGDLTPRSALMDAISLLERDRSRFLVLGGEQRVEPWASYFDRGFVEGNIAVTDWLREFERRGDLQ